MEISKFDKILTNAFSVVSGNVWVVLEDTIKKVETSRDFLLDEPSEKSFDQEVELLEALKDRLMRIQETISDLPEMYRHAENVADVKNRLSNKCQDIYRLLSDFFVTYRNNTDATFLDLYKRGIQFSTLEEAEEKLVGFYADLAMLDIEADMQYADKLDKKIAIVRLIDELRNVMFSYILISLNWDSQEAEKVLRFFQSPNVDVITKQLLVSALTLSCSNAFDYSKLRILVRLMEDSSEKSVSLRALVGLMFCVQHIPSSYESAVETLLKEVFEKNPSLMKLFLNACKIELHARNKSESNEAFGKQLISTLFNQTKNMLKNESEHEDDYDYDDSMEDEEEELSNSLLDDVFEMVDKGTDMYYGQFKDKRKLEFFRSVYSWFMPFYTDSVPFMELEKELGEGYSEVVNKFLSISNMCDSDLYSFLGILSKSHDEAKKMFEHVKNEIHRKKEAPEQVSELRYIICYIHCLSRFYDFAPMRSSFVNPFGEDDMEQVQLPLTSSVFADSFYGKYRLRLARYCFKHGDFYCIPDLLNEDYPDTKECHYMLAKAYFDMREDEEAFEPNCVQALPHIDWLIKHDPDNPVFVDLATDVYYVSMLTDRVETCWKHLISVTKDEDVLMHAKKRLAVMYLLIERYDEAAKLFYELNYKEPESPEYLSLLAKTLLLKSPGDIGVARKVLSMLDSFKETRVPDPLKNLTKHSDIEELGNKDEVFSDFMNKMTDFLNEDHSRDSDIAIMTSLCRWVIMEDQKEGEGTYTFQDVLQPLIKVYRLMHTKPFMKELVTYYEPIFESKYVEWLHSFGIDDNDIALLDEALRTDYNKKVGKSKDLLEGLFGNGKLL